MNPYVNRHSVCEPTTVPRFINGNVNFTSVDRNVQQATPCYVTNMHRHVSSSHVEFPRTDQQIPTTSSVFVHPYLSSNSDHAFIVSPYGRVKEMISLLPELNPSSDESVNSNVSRY